MGVEGCRGHVRKGGKKRTHILGSSLCTEMEQGEFFGGKQTLSKKKKKEKSAHIPFWLLESLNARDRSNFWT